MLGTLSGLKILLGKSLADVSIDPQLMACLDVAEQAMRTYCKRPGLVSPPVTYSPVYLTGSGIDTLLLPHYPITALASIYEDFAGYFGTGTNPFPANTLLTEGTDYVLERDDPSGQYLSLSGVVRRLKSLNIGALTGIIPSLPYGTLTGGTRGPCWSKAPGCLKIAFTAGYIAGSVPADLQGAVNEIAAWVKRNAPYGGNPITSENLGSYGYTLAVAGITGAPPLGSARQALSAYRQRFL
jgi:hypothetical protein